MFLVMRFRSEGGNLTDMSRVDTIDEACNIGGAYLTLPEEDCSIFSDGLRMQWDDYLNGDYGDQHRQITSCRLHDDIRVFIVQEPMTDLARPEHFEDEEEPPTSLTDHLAESWRLMAADEERSQTMAADRRRYRDSRPSMGKTETVEWYTRQARGVDVPS